MELSIKVLQKYGACSEGVKWYQDYGCPKTVTGTVNLLLDSSNSNKLSWSIWLIARMLSRKDEIRYAIFAAEQVIEIFEKQYPDDKRPRNAIEAAKKVLKNPSLKNKNAAANAYAAAVNAAAAANAAYTVAAANAAYAAAANAACAAANAAYAAAVNAAAANAYAAAAAAYAAAANAACAAANAAAEMKLKIIRYGLSLIT
jgi:hypothetical protein